MIDFFTNGWNIAVILIGLTFSVVLWIKGKGSNFLRGYIPTLWTSLGILCTFMAIYVSLSDYTNIVSSDAVNGSGLNTFDINDLIKDVIPAFSTSIIGIIGAIISTIINRWIGDNQEKADYEQFLKIKNRIPGQKLQSSSPEMVLLEIISAIRETSNQTCEKLRNNNDTSGKKLEQINSKLSTIDSTAAAVGDRIKSAITDNMSKQREEFTSSISLLISTLSSELKSQSTSMANKMDDLRRMLHDEVEHIETTNQNLLTKLINQEDNLLKLTTQTLLNDSEIRNKSLQEFITTQSEGLEETFAEITAGMGALYQKIEENITNHIEDEKSLFEHDIKDSIEEFAKAQYQTCTETISICNKQLTDNIEQLHQTQVQSSIDFISNVEAVFIKTCDEFKSKIQLLSESITIKLGEINEDNISSWTTVIEQGHHTLQLMLENHSNELKTTTEYIKEEDTKFHQAFAAEHHTMQNKLIEQFDLYLGEIQTAMKETRNLMESNSQSVSHISSSISESLTKLSLEVQTSNEKFLSQLEVQRTQIIESAGTMYNDIQCVIARSSQITQLKALAKDISVSIEKTIETISKEMTRVSSVLGTSVDAIEKSAQIYSDSVVKSDMVTRYMEGTSRLFMEHNNAIAILEKSLNTMVESIIQMKENLISQNDRKIRNKPLKK